MSKSHIDDPSHVSKLPTQDAKSIQGVPVDDSAKADNRVLVYDAATGTLGYEAGGGGGGDTHPMVETTKIVKDAGNAKWALIDVSTNGPGGDIVVAWPAANLDLATVLTAAAVVTNNAVVRGDGGARGLQESVLVISDGGFLDFTGINATIISVGTSQVLSLIKNTGGDAGENRVAMNNADTYARIYVVGPYSPADLYLKGAVTGKVKANNDGTYRQVATLDGVEILAGKILTLPQINDTSLDHQYVFDVSELAADRTVLLPLLADNDEFVFKDHAQTLTNKSIVASQLTGTIAGARLATKHKTITRALQIPAPADEEEYIVEFCLNACTVIEINAHCSAGSVNFNFEHRAKTTPSTPSAVKLWAADKAITAVSKTYPGDGAFTDATVLADKVLALTFDNPSSVGTVRITMAVTIDD